MNKYGFPRLMNFKYFVSVTMLFNSFFIYSTLRHKVQHKYHFSVSRRISRITGYLTSMPLPPILRVGLYKAFGSVYGVNYDEILVEDLNSFRTFNQFFTRELKPDARAIDEP